MWRRRRMLSSDLFPQRWVWKHVVSMKEPDIPISMAMAKPMLFVNPLVVNNEPTLSILEYTCFGTSPWYGFYKWAAFINFDTTTFFCLPSSMLKRRVRVGSTSLLLWDVASSGRAFVIRNGGQLIGWALALAAAVGKSLGKSPFRFFINSSIRRVEVACDMGTTLSCQIEEYQWNWQSPAPKSLHLVQPVDSYSKSITDDVFYLGLISLYRLSSLSPKP